MSLNVALIGAGRIGKVHAKSIAMDERCRLVAVADVMAEAAEDLAMQSGCAARSVQEILDDPSIGAILVASSTNTHADLIERGVAAGKALLCEKPVDLNLKRARACAKVAAKSDKPVMMGFNRRFDPNFAALKKAADAGEVGRPETLTLTSFDPAPPPLSYIKVSGGQFRDQMIHDFDIACWLLGMPEKVTATGSCLVDPNIGALGDVDTSVVILHYADGRLATIRNTRRACYGHDQRIELFGSDGMLSVGNMLENTLVKSTGEGVTGAKPVHFFLERYMRAYEEEWRQFVDAVLQAGKAPVSIEDGVNALTLAEAAIISRTEERTVVVNTDLP